MDDQRAVISALAVVILFVSSIGCSEITEFQDSYTGSLVVLSSDLQIVQQLDGLRDPSSLLLHEGRIFVFSSQGTVYDIDPSNMEITAEHSVGPPFPSGYRNPVYCPSEGKAYVTGAYSTLLELSLPDCEVLDQFMVCASPGDLEVSSGNPGYLWVIDTVNNRMYQVSLEYNQSVNQVGYSEETPVQCLAAAQAPDSLVVGTSCRIYKVTLNGEGGIRNAQMGQFIGDVKSIRAVPNRTDFLVATESMAGLMSIFMEEYRATLNWTSATSIEGHDHEILPLGDGMNAVSLSFMTQGSIRVCKYYYCDGFTRTAQIDLDSYATDIAVSQMGEGLIYLLLLDY